MHGPSAGPFIPKENFMTSIHPAERAQALHLLAEIRRTTEDLIDMAEFIDLQWLTASAATLRAVAEHIQHRVASASSVEVGRRD
jgi:hypothetical protein